MTFANRHHSGKRKATLLVLLVFLLPVVVGIAAYAINLAYMELVRVELQISTDIATRAAGRTLAVTGSKSEAIANGQRYALLNPVCNLPLHLTSTDLVFGVSTRTSENERYLFEQGKNPNAVKIKTDNFANSSIPMLFPSMGMPIEFRSIKSAISTQSELDLSLVLDRSGSMTFSASEQSGSTFPNGWYPGQPVPYNSRWLDTVASVDLLLQQLSLSHLSEHVSLVTYSTSPTTDVKLTDQYQDIYDEMYAYGMSFAGGATNIGGGILQGVASLNEKGSARPWASRVIILMSDGIHNTGIEPLLAAQIAADQHITIYTISFSSEADEAVMSKIASTCRGLHYHAATREQLETAFRDILSRLPLLVTF